MKKMVMITVIGLTLLLSGCEVERDSNVIDTDDVNYEEIYEQYYAGIEYIPPTEESGVKDWCSDLEDGQKLHIEVDTFLPVELDEMIEDTRTDFIYGEVYKIEDYNCISYNAYLKVYETGFKDDERPLIRISVIHGDVLVEGKTYILNLTYSSEPDFYSLSQSYYSVFHVNTSGNVVRDTVLEDKAYTLDEFLDEVFAE